MDVIASDEVSVQTFMDTMASYYEGDYFNHQINETKKNKFFRDWFGKL